MAKLRKKKRQVGKRVVETALPKKQYKRTNRLLFAFSVILLVVFGGGAALVGGGAPPPKPVTPVVSTQNGTPADQTLPPSITSTPPASTTATSSTPTATP